MLDIIKARDPNQHGIKYYLDSVQPIKNETQFGQDESKEALFELDETNGVL
jgi:hypothetical protein